VYVAFTGYREDDRTPYLYLSTDGGTTFRSIVNDLPTGGSVNVVREHPRNPDCVLVGTEFGCYASVDGGASWHALGQGLPTQPVHDLTVHPREEDVVIGTHGRGLWILDGTALRELNAEVLGQSAHVFQPRDGRLTRRTFPTVRYPGALGWRADRAENRAVFRYYLGREPDGRVNLTVLDVAGDEVFQRPGETEPGLHEVVWSPPRGRRGGRQGRTAGPGQYLLRVQIGDQTFERAFRVRPAPGTTEADATDDGDAVEVGAGRAVDDAPRRGSR
jgi:hypothetical protein